MRDQYDIVIVGGGHGGAQTAISLRQQGYSGSLAIIGEEPEPPYERPPLSKEYLAGSKPWERILLRPLGFWAGRDIDLVLGSRVTEVDAVRHALRTERGESIRYGQLVWAAGGHARRLTCDGHDLAGVHSVRNRADVDRMAAELADTSCVVIIGGGYIGLEAAAVLTKLGKQVVVAEAQDRVLARVAGEVLSRFYEGEHRAHGVTIRTNAQVQCIEGQNGRVIGVRLADGELLPCQLAIVGIGIVPAVLPLLAAGAEGSNGVRVDMLGRTSLPDVFAVGDCALHTNRFAGNAAIRLESVQNANDMAGTVAKTITGATAPYEAVPWFWSNQYDLRLQTIGLSGGYDQTVTRGEPSTRSFSVIYLRKRRVIALDCVNATRDYVQGRQLVIGSTEMDPEQLRTSPTLKELVPTPSA